MQVEKKQPKVIKIRVEYSDGSVREAVDSAAAKIMDHWNGLEQFAFIHNRTYSGPVLEEVKQKPSEMTLTADEVAAIRKHKGKRPSPAFVKAKLRAIREQAVKQVKKVANAVKALREERHLTNDKLERRMRSVK